MAMVEVVVAMEVVATVVGAMEEEAEATEEGVEDTGVEVVAMEDGVGEGDMAAEEEEETEGTGETVGVALLGDTTTNTH